MSLFLNQQMYSDTHVDSLLTKVHEPQQLCFWWVRPSTAISSASSISILVLHNCPFLALICGITRPYNTLPISKLGNGNLTILEREMQLVTFPSSLIWGWLLTLLAIPWPMEKYCSKRAAQPFLRCELLHFARLAQCVSGLVCGLGAHFAQCVFYEFVPCPSARCKSGLSASKSHSECKTWSIAEPCGPLCAGKLF